jgi:chemotaxis methyl-accepting protein methylase
MVTYQYPAAVDVLYPNAGDYKVRMVTELFRTSSHLSQAVDLGVTVAQTPGVLSVVSGGCSNFAEGYSVLTALELGDYGVKGEVTGYDANGKAIDHAHRASYLARTTTDNQAAIRQRLQTAGFTVGEETRDGGRYEGGDIRYLEADASDLRARHGVSLHKHDLLRPVTGTADADLVLVNHVLLHFPYEQAERLVFNLASLLSDKGILSLGQYGFQPYRHADEFRAYRARKLTAFLDDHFCLKRLEVPGTPDAIMFSRSEITSTG